MTSLREEDVAEDHAADGWVRIDRGSRPRAVALSAQQQLSLAGHTVGRPPDRPRLADPHLDVLVEEAPANEVIPRDIEALELLRVLGLEEKRLARRQRLEAVRRRLPEVGLREVIAVAEEGRPPVVCDSDDDPHKARIEGASRLTPAADRATSTECCASPPGLASGLRVPRRVGGEHSVAPESSSREVLTCPPSRGYCPFQPTTMTTAQLAAVSFLARYAGHTHELYAYQLRRWFEWCEGNGLDPLVGIQRAHVELYIRSLGEAGLMASSTNTMMHGVRGFFRFAHIDGLIPADPAVYARLPKVHSDESRTQGLDRLELIRFLQIAQTITVHHGALAYLLGNQRATRL